MASTDCNITYDAICPTQAEKLSHVLEESASYQERDTTLMGVTCNPAELDLSCVSVPSEDLSTVKSNSSFAETDDLVASSAAHSSHTGADSFHDGLDQSFVDEEAIEEISAPVSRSGRCLRRKFFCILLY